MQSGHCESKLLMVIFYLLLYFQSLFSNRTHWRQVAEAPCQKNIKNVILMSAMGSCIKVVKQINLVSYWKKNVVSCNRPKPKRPLFCFGYLQNYKTHSLSVGNCFAISSSAYVRIISLLYISFVFFCRSLKKDFSWRDICKLQMILCNEIMDLTCRNTSRWSNPTST
jgi:hypothetical protein